MLLATLPTRPRVVSLSSPALAQADDAGLARAAMQGDAHAPGAIWDRFAPTVRRTLRRTLGPSVDVEDLTQEVFLRVFRQVHTLRDPAALKSFIVGVSIRVLGSELRRRRVRRFLLLTDQGTLPDAPGLPQDPAARSALTTLYRVLDGVHAETRLLFSLRYFEGMQVAEIAGALGVSLATAKRRLAKATAHVERLVAREPALRAYLMTSSPGGQA